MKILCLLPYDNCNVNVFLLQTRFRKQLKVLEIRLFDAISQVLTTCFSRPTRNLLRSKYNGVIRHHSVQFSFFNSFPPTNTFKCSIQRTLTLSKEGRIFQTSSNPFLFFISIPKSSKQELRIRANFT